MAGKIIKIKASDGHTLDGYLSSPAGTPKAGLIVLQEIFGVNAHMKHVTTTSPPGGTWRSAPPSTTG